MGGFQYLDVDRALEQVGELEALHDMLGMLQSSLGRDLPLMAHVLAQGDAKEACRLLHAFKGFIPIFCVDALCDHVALVEALSKTASAPEIDAAYTPLEPKLRQLQAEIDAHLRGKDWGGMQRLGMQDVHSGSEEGDAMLRCKSPP